MTEVADTLSQRGAILAAAKLRAAIRPKIDSKVAEALRLLRLVADQASGDPGLLEVAARTSLLAHEIEQHYSASEGNTWE